MVFRFKITFLTPVSLKEWGGVENWIFQMAELLSRKHQVAVVSNAVTSKTRIKQIPWHTFNYYEIPTFTIVSIKPSIILLRVPQWLRDFDIIYLYHTSLAYSYQVLSMYKQPIVLGVHSELLSPIKSGIAQKFYLLAFRHLSRKTAKIACRSNNQIEFLHKHFGIGKDRIFLNRPFIDANMYKPSNSKNHFTALFAGRFAAGKGIPTLEEATEYLGKDVRLMFVGNGERRYELIVEKMSKQLPNVIWKHVLMGKKLARTYAQASVLINPSQSETFPNVVLQSLASGTPVILSKIPAHLELVAMLPEGTYSLFTCGSSLELAKEILKWKKLIERDEAHYKEICAKLSDFVRCNFSGIQAAKSFESMIQKVLETELQP